ncbi:MULTISPECIES: hypothetical protein [Flavobacteriaceae]|nr:hypothetical protein [Maribacter luteus]
MKLIFKLQIFVVHLWFLVCTYLMLTKNDKPDYIGKTEPDKTELYEILFYISLAILVAFYISILGKKLLKKSK